MADYSTVGADGAIRLLVTCWCEAHTVWVTEDDVFVGLTGPCRDWRCRSIDHRARVAARVSV